MPLKEDPSCLGESRQTAIQRLNSVWKRLSRDKEYLSLYEKFLQEYEDLGHMREIKTDGSGVSFYMPHHGVYRPEKSTTKLRTVFNASSPSTSRKSLNSIQFNGGLVQEDLFSIMVRFRKHKYAFTTDIEKMFRMINIHPEQTCLQRILWKKGIGEPIKTYELTTVTYGTVSAPYLATRTLKQLAMDEANNFPLAAPVVLSDCYMDGILSGSESIEKVIELQRQLIEMFKAAGMHLHKWCENLPEITSNLQEYAFLESEETKALGIIWNPKLDYFLFRIEHQSPTSFTKRMVLSTIARIFDPLGLFGLIITWAKIFMQRLWLLELGWSDELPFKEEKEWRRFIDSLEAVNNIAIDRCIVIHRAESIELHAFSDASFLHNCRFKVKKREPLTTSDVNDAETWLIKQDQSGINLSDPSDQNLAAYFTEEGIEWNFIPPSAPHMGGLWEAGIKSVKYHLKRALRRSRLTYEEFETVIISRWKEF
ncbi:integrase catalytic domain-containing protein [Trichonephila clavipes]|nr:integrase catalytic domain-containing protein [Trichonephila clavipes]